jgi:hypothetical protein
MREWQSFLKDDRDYDWMFIIRVLRYKLERTQKHIVEHDICVDAPKIGKQFQAVVDLLKRIEADPYHDEVYGPFYKKWGKSKLVFGPKTDRNMRPVTIQYANETPANRPQLEQEFVALMGQDHKLRERDLRQAFRLMQKHIWGWWD